MSKIVYLLGAGASAQAMPLVKDFNVRLRIFHDFFANVYQNAGSVESKFISDLAKLRADVTNHYSIDTLAKKHFLTGSHEYHKLKALLTCFFCFECFQIDKNSNVVNGVRNGIWRSGSSQEYRDGIAQWEQTIDLRYDALLAALIKSPANLSIPTEINFISWNYDDQLEFAANNIVQAYKKDGKDAAPLVQSIDSQKGKPLPSTNLVKLNGSYLPDIAAFDKIKDAALIKLFVDRSISDNNVFLWSMLYKRLVENPEFLKLNFAWEHSLETDRRITRALQITEEATDLVIIGYSFPNYNVEIDQFVFGNKSYDRIYIEDTPENYAGILERLEYIGIGDVDQLEKGRKLRNHRDLKTFCLPPSFYGISTGKRQRPMVL